MKLDYIEGTKAFLLRVLRGEQDISLLMREHGLNLSEPASSSGEAVLFTRDPYCAASFSNYATPRARGQLNGILQEIEASFASSSNARIKCPVDKELWPFQKADVNSALRRRNTLIGD